MGQSDAEPFLCMVVDARTCIGHPPLAFSEIILPYGEGARAFVEVPRYKDQEADAAEDPQGIGTEQIGILYGNNRRCDTNDNQSRENRRIVSSTSKCTTPLI